MALLDRCIFQAASAGTGNFVQVINIAGFQTMQNAGAVDGTTYSYAAQLTDLSQWEVGIGTWSAGTNTLDRTTVLYNNLTTTAKIDFSSAPQVMISALTTDFMVDPLFLTQGLNLTATNPLMGVSANEKSAFYLQTTTDASIIPPGFTNLDGQIILMNSIWGDNSYGAGSVNKTTYLPINIYHNAYAAGQRFVEKKTLNAYGMGDAFIDTIFMSYASGPIPGDEGTGYTPVTGIHQQTTGRQFQIFNPTRAAGNTTITVNVLKGLGPQTVPVASTANINPGEWYIVQRMPAAAAWNAEAIKIISVGVGTITAEFRNDHPNGSTITPALVVGHDYPYPGQFRVVVNLSGASYSTGTVTGNPGGAVLLGDITTVWTNNMVGGDAINIGAISLDKDTYARGPFVGEPLLAWLEINNVIPFQLQICSNTVAGDTSYHSSRGTFPTNYIIRPAVRIMTFDAGLNLLILDTTTTVWNNGDICEMSVCPYPDVTGFQYSVANYTPNGTLRGLMSFSNAGPTPFDIGFSVGGNPFDKAWAIGTGFSATQTKIGMHIEATDVGIELNNKIDFSAGAACWINGLGPAGANGLELSYNTGFVLKLINPGVDVNPDPNLGEALFTSTYLKLTSAGANPARIEVSDTKFVPDNAVGESGLAGDIKFGDRGINIHGQIGNPAELVSQVFASGFAVKGVLELGSLTMTLVNGDNAVTLTRPASFLRIIGPTGAFAITNIAEGGSWGPTGGGGNVCGDGTILKIFNTTANQMTIRNNAGGSDCIFTMTGADVVLRAGTSCATLMYSGNDSHWVLMSTN